MADDVLDLALAAADAHISDCLDSLVADDNIICGDETDEELDSACVEDALDLAVGAGGDVGKGPAGFIPDAFLGGVQQLDKDRDG